MRARQGVVTLAFALALVTVSGAASWAWAQPTRGEARIGGKVVDETGKPAANVAVKAQLTGQMPPLQTKTNNKGEWSFNNIAGGIWDLEFTKEGFGAERITVEVKPDQRISTIDVAMKPPAPDPNAEIQAEVKRAATLFQNKQIAEGRKIYETLLAKYPTLHQLHEFIGRTYAAEGQYDQAIEHVRIAVDKDPDNVQAKVFLGDLLMEKGDKAEAQKLLESIDLTKVEDPAPFINLVIGKINEQKADEALALLQKLMTRFPNDASLYYYRGRAHLAAKKLPEAKADLEKFTSMALPDARELPDAKRILEQMKDVK
jgi:tetratricopeptide (TPR) repeat protein